MNIQKLTLIKKTKVAQNTFELIFRSNIKATAIPWQFITFMLKQTKFARAYSIVWTHNNDYIFIIKRLENWRWWSKEICDLKINDTIKSIWPNWHFIINDIYNSKLFISTWVGLAPLFFMVNNTLKNWNKNKIKLLFWLREEKDLFYYNKLISLKNKYNNFEFEIYFSRENVNWFKKWYITDYINSDNIKWFDEFYICWNPNVIESSKKKLKQLNIDSKNIFNEKY